MFASENQLLEINILIRDECARAEAALETEEAVSTRWKSINAQVLRINNTIRYETMLGRCLFNFHTRRILLFSVYVANKRDAV